MVHLQAGAVINIAWCTRSRNGDRGAVKHALGRSKKEFLDCVLVDDGSLAGAGSAAGNHFISFNTFLKTPPCKYVPPERGGSSRTGTRRPDTVPMPAEGFMPEPHMGARPPGL